MFRIALMGVLLLAAPATAMAQFSGNAAFAASVSGAKLRAEQAELSKRALTEHELPPGGTSMFVEASVLANVKADEYVAVFALSQEGASVAECGQKLETTLKLFREGLQPLGIGNADVYVDFVAQNKIYGYEIAGDLAREKLAGFDLKKNVSIRFQDPNLLDNLLAAAAAAQIHDLVKVDYVVKAPEKIQDELMAAAARVVARKTGRYEKLLGTKVLPRPQIYAERHAAHYPIRLYESYIAQESEYIDGGVRRDRLAVQGARKTRTFYYNGLDANGFDEVLNPVALEPMVQFTLYLKVRFELEPLPAK